MARRVDLQLLVSTTQINPSVDSQGTQLIPHVVICECKDTGSVKGSALWWQGSGTSESFGLKQKTNDQNLLGISWIL